MQSINKYGYTYAYVPHPKIDTTSLLCVLRYVRLHIEGHPHRAEPVIMEQIFLSGRLRRSLSCIPYACMIPQSYGVASDLLLTIITIMTNGNHTDIEMMLSELGVIRIVMCTPSGNITTLILRLAVVRDHGEKCHGSRGYKPPFRISKWYIIVIPLLALVMAPGLLLSALS